MNILSFLQNVDVSSLLVAFIGGAVSVLTALYLTSRKINSEFQLRRIEVTKGYSESILKERLTNYKSLWVMLSAYIKILDGFHQVNGNSTPLAIDNLIKFHHDINEWDSNNAILLSKYSSVVMFQLRLTVLNIVNAHNATNSIELLSEDEKKKIMTALSFLEVSIKTDIGIYEVDDFERKKIFRGYYDVEVDGENVRKLMQIDKL